jgi:hypothetical protein
MTCRYDDRWGKEGLQKATFQEELFKTIIQGLREIFL